MINPVWERDEENDKFVLHLFTFNEVNNQSFLLRTEKGNSKLGALTKILTYLESEHAQEYSWTVSWTHKGDGEMHKSYFRAVNVPEVLAKEHEDAFIYSIERNPLA